MKRLALILIGILGIFLLALTGCNEIKYSSSSDDVCTDTVEPSNEECFIPSVYDILNEREGLKYSRMIDSVYLQIPEEILTYQLIENGTLQSTMAIVEDYLAHKEFYHDTILKAIKISKRIPDKIPEKPDINEPHNSTDIDV